MSSEPAISSFLDDLMHRRKLLPSQLANELGVSHATISRWLSGEDVPSVSSCRRLAGFCGMPVEQILSIVGHLPGAGQGEGRWPELSRNARRGPARHLADDLIRMMEDLIGGGPARSAGGTKS